MVDTEKLRQWLNPYENPAATFRDILNVISHYKSLSPKFNSYTFMDGRTMFLVNLDGTIPVSYKGSTYNIPICVWLIDTYPKNAPICYVKPTPDMSIKVSIYVDQNGKIYLPYLHDWVPTSSDLIGLIQVMIVVFGEQCPVFAKPKSDNNLPFSYMPKSGGFGSSPYPPSAASSNFQGGAPYPGTASGGYPPYPVNNNNAFPSFPPYPNSPFPSFPAASAGGNFIPSNPSVSGGTIKDEHIRESLLTAIEEKLLRKMKEQFLQNQAEIQTLKTTQAELKQGKAKLDGLFNRLDKEEKDLEKNITLLRDKEQELNNAIEKIGNQESIDVDDAVTTTAPLYKQLLNAFAEEAAQEDAIYYIGEALRCGVIDLDVFLRQVRSLSRKQFMLRELMQKCRQKAGLAA